MSKIITLASGKGGTGKSSVCTGLAMALAKRNNKVLLIDCDCGMRGLDLLLGITGRLVFDAADIVRGTCNYSAAIYEQEAVKEVCLLSAPLDTEDEISPGVMKQIVSELKPYYDYILIDAPAGVGSGFLTAAFPAEKALVVINPEPAGLRGCENVCKRLNAIGVSDIRLVINNFDYDRFVSLGAYSDLDEVIDIAGVQLLGIVPADNKFAAILQRGCSEYTPTEASVAFDCIAARLEGETAPISIKF